MLSPIVSVIVPTKNSSATLADCLESIKAQTYENIELIVVDNFSEDRTPKIALKYADKFFSRGPERSPQRNYGVKKSAGKYVVIIDSDMKLAPGVIQSAVSLMEKNTKLSGVIIPEESYGEGFWAQCKKLERSFYVGVHYMEASRFFNKKQYLSVGGYDESMISGEDWDLSQRMENLGKLGRVDEFIYHNEGKISLLKSIKKKFYYAEKFSHYRSVQSSAKNVAQQTSVIGRYKLFFSQPAKLFHNPVLGMGMLFMKTCEFGFGAAGYVKAKLRKV